MQGFEMRILNILFVLLCLSVSFAAAAPEPSLFQGMDSTATVAGRAEVSIGPASDDLPPPAYQPPPKDADPAPVGAEFVAPKAPAAGTPTPEALARLKAAVQSSGVRKPPSSSPSKAAEAPTATDKPRFGINSLINRMTGHQANAPAARAASPIPPKRAVNVATDEAENDAENERIEIPAFLRRQAN